MSDFTRHEQWLKDLGYPFAFRTFSMNRERAKSAVKYTLNFLKRTFKYFSFFMASCPWCLQLCSHPLMYKEKLWISSDLRVVNKVKIIHKQIENVHKNVFLKCTYTVHRERNEINSYAICASPEKYFQIFYSSVVSWLCFIHVSKKTLYEGRKKKFRFEI